MKLNKLQIAASLFLLAELLATSSAQGSTVQILTSTLCGIVGGVRAVVGVIALAMFLIGGILYASGTFLPAAGNVRSQTQSWAMAMLIGGVIGVVLVIAAPLIVSIVIGFNTGSAALRGASCP